MAILNVAQPILQSAIITVVLWLFLVSLAFLRLRKVTVEERMNEMPKLMILAFSAAAAGTLAITVAVALFFPQFIEIDTGTVYTAGLLGAAISLWWTLAVFWREIKTIQKGAPDKEPRAILPLPIEEHEETQSTVAGLCELLRLLRVYMNRWEQYTRLSKDERLQLESRIAIQADASTTSSDLLRIDSEYADSWDDPALRNQVQTVSDQLRKFAISEIRTISDYEAMENKGKDAYDKVRALLSLFEPRID
jgi:hypothetical protein